LRIDDGRGFENAPAVWESAAIRSDEATIVIMDTPPIGWTPPPDDVTAYAAVDIGGRVVGLPVEAVDGRTICVARYPAPDISRVRIEAVRMVEG
jgi:hypothetical protein